jgi:putative ABC transport system substrate-binding protein
MRRRDLMTGFGLLPLAIAGRGSAQPQNRIPRIGYLTLATGSPDNVAGVAQIRTFVEGLRALGWVDGRNITIDHRYSGTGAERILARAKELVASQPELILTVGSQTLAAVLAETRTIPVVFTLVPDPVANGYVASLARPGGNATGFAIGEAPIAGKWLEILKEIAPHTGRVLVLMQADAPPQQLLSDVLAAAAPQFGVSLLTATVRELADYEREIAAFAGEPNGALVVLSNPVAASNRERIHAFAARYRLPAVYSYPVYAKTGGLVSYGPDNLAMLRDATGYIDRILRGEKPGDLPVQLPTRFVLAVNLKTARTLDLTVPPSLLARADEVIE